MQVGGRGAKVGLYLYVKQSLSCITNYCMIFHMNICKPTFAPACRADSDFQLDNLHKPISHLLPESKNDTMKGGPVAKGAVLFRKTGLWARRGVSC